MKVPAGFYIAMYAIGEGQGSLVMWNPARDYVYQARPVITERRAIGNPEEGGLLPPPPANPNPPAGNPNPPQANPNLPPGNPNPPPGGTPNPPPAPPIPPEPPQAPKVALAAVVGAWEMQISSPIEP